VDDILENAQRYFYALRIRNYPENLNFSQYSNLERRDVDDAEEELPVKTLASTYIPEEHRLRDTGFMPGPKVLTFSSIIKHNLFPLPALLTDLLSLGARSLGCPVEIEFSVNLRSEKGRKGDFFFLQVRPMASDVERFDVHITETELENAVCRSAQALGRGIKKNIKDIVYVKPDDFKTESTVEIAREIARINADLLSQNCPYLLIGPGRWGSADRWLGIPVQWKDISAVGAIIELRNEKMKADPSQGSHFFLNITSLGIHYITVTEGSGDFLDWPWLHSRSVIKETSFLRHVRLEKPLTVKIDSSRSLCAIIIDGSPETADEISQSCHWWLGR
jgi:hypothetical protein